MEFKQKFVRSKILKSFCRFVYLRISETIRSLSGSSSKRRYLDISTLQARTEHSSKGRTHAATSVANTKAIPARNSRTVRITSSEIPCEMKLNRRATSWRHAHFLLTTPRNSRIVEFESRTRIVVCVTIARDGKSGERRCYELCQDSGSIWGAGSAEVSRETRSIQTIR